MYIPASPYLQLLENRMQIKRIPFSDRGSRLLVYQSIDQEHTVYVKLAERLLAVQAGLSTYRSRQAFISRLNLVDGNGQKLPFDVTTYPHALVFHTPLGDFVLVFQDQQTLTFGLPNGVACGVRFTVLPDIARPLQHGGEFKSIRNCAYSTNGTVVLNEIGDDGHGYSVILTAEGDINTAIALTIRADLDLAHTVLPFRHALAAAETRWHQWFARCPAVDEPYRSQYYYAWWVLCNNILSPRGFFRRESVAPSKAHYVGAWQWDNYFHALAFRHTDQTLARDQVLFMLDHQQPNGMLPDAVHDEGTITHLDIPVSAAVTKPPIAAWVVMHIFDTTGDVDLLHEAYDGLVRWNSWWFGLNDEDNDGIVQYSHPFSSGLDDSPLWDGGVPVEAVDLNTYLCIQMESLARMAHILGRTHEATMWQSKADALAQRMIEHFYDAKTGLFWFQKHHQRIDVRTPFSLYPLWTNRLTAHMNDRLVAHLCDPATFWTTYPLPTVAVDDPAYDPFQMWRGPVWININYIFVEALQRTGYIKQASELAERTLSLVMSQDDIYEYYHPDTGVAPPKAAPAFGWSAACFIDLAIRQSRNQI